MAERRPATRSRRGTRREASRRHVADPAIMADHVRFRGLRGKFREAQVDALYARWTKLEAKRDAWGGG